MIFWCVFLSYAFGFSVLFSWLFYVLFRYYKALKKEH